MRSKRVMVLCLTLAIFSRAAIPSALAAECSGSCHGKAGSDERLSGHSTIAMGARWPGREKEVRIYAQM